MSRGRVGLAALAAAGCWWGGGGGGAADHERLGDEHYRAGRYPEAAAEYRTAQATAPVPRIWAKLGAASWHTGDFPLSLEAYRQLALADPTRQQEAARGLERVLRAASREQAQGAMVAAALVALRQAAPDRPLPRPALRVASLDRLGGEEAVSVLPAALAAADRTGDVDRLLVRWGQAFQATTACEAATRTFRTAIRRTTDPRLRGEARAGLAGCALQLGLDALAADRSSQAEDWFSAAMNADLTGPLGHQARLGLGDARFRQGDLLGAALWWQSVLGAPGIPDSLAQAAAERLTRLGAAETPPAVREPRP